MLQIVRAKLHGITVTEADLHYHGSITLDPDQCTQAGIRPLEFVDIFNKNNGARWRTYVIFGEAGSRCCILNGPSARQCEKGDQLIICASAFVEEQALFEIKPQILTFSANNTIHEILSYEVFESEERPFDFLLRIQDTFDSDCEVGVVDLTGLRRELRAHGLSDHTVANIVSKHLNSTR